MDLLSTSARVWQRFVFDCERTSPGCEEPPLTSAAGRLQAAEGAVDPGQVREERV